MSNFIHGYIIEERYDMPIRSKYMSIIDDNHTGAYNMYKGVAQIIL